MTLPKLSKLFRWTSRKSGARMVKFRIEHTFSEDHAAEALSYGMSLYAPEELADLLSTPDKVLAELRSAMGSMQVLEGLYGCDDEDEDDRETRMERLAEIEAALAAL